MIFNYDVSDIKNALNSAHIYFSVGELGLTGTPTMAAVASAMPNSSVACLQNSEVDQSALSNPLGADINVITIYKISTLRCFALGARTYNSVVLSDANVVYAAFDGTSWVGWKKILVSDGGNLAIGNGGTGASTAATARDNLGLIYAANDTHTAAASVALSGFITTDTTQFYGDYVVPRSLENISSVTVTALTGTLRGISGYVNSSSSNVNFTTGNYTATATKLTNNRVRISILKSAAFTNVTNNTPVTYWGTLALKFT